MAFNSLLRHTAPLLALAVAASGWGQTSHPECDLLLNGADVGHLASTELVEAAGKPVTVIVKTSGGMLQDVYSWLFAAIDGGMRTPISLAVRDSSGKPTKTLKLNDPIITSAIFPEQHVGATGSAEWTISIKADSVSRTNGVPHRPTPPNFPPRPSKPVAPWSGSKFKVEFGTLKSTGLVSVGAMKFTAPGKNGRVWPEVTLTFSGKGDVAGDWLTASHSARPYARARIVALRDDGKTVHFDLNLYQVAIEPGTSRKSEGKTIVEIKLKFGNMGVLIGQ